MIATEAKGLYIEGVEDERDELVGRPLRLELFEGCSALFCPLS